MKWIAWIWLASILVIAGWIASIPKLPHNVSTTSNCRNPDIETEFKVIIQWQDVNHRLHTECSIEPRNSKEGRFKTMQRILKREQNDKKE